MTAGAILLGLMVAVGAFGAHGLKDILSEYGKDIFEKGVFYHAIHGLAVLILPIAEAQQLLSEKLAFRAISCFSAGVLLFSGSLYLLAITEKKWLGAITPLGGTLFLVGWALVAYGSWKR